MNWSLAAKVLGSALLVLGSMMVFSQGGTTRDFVIGGALMAGGGVVFFWGRRS